MGVYYNPYEGAVRIRGSIPSLRSFPLALGVFLARCWGGPILDRSGGGLGMLLEWLVLHCWGSSMVYPRPNEECLDSFYMGFRVLGLGFRL